MKNLLRFSNKNIAREMIDKRFKECCYFGLLKIVITLNWKEITKSNSVVLSKSKCFSVRQFLMQTDNSYRKIPPIKLHVYFTISILKTYYFKWRFGRIRNTIIKKMAYLEGPTKQDRPWVYRQKFTVLICEVGIYLTYLFNL